MKKLATLAIAMGLVASSYAQGYFNFNNYADAGTGAGPFIASTGVPGEGAIGSLLGSDGSFATPNYDVAYLWANGQGLTQAQFDGSVAGGATLASFLAVTGDVADGAGIIGGGSDPVPGAVTTDGQLITVQVEAWYDPTGSTTYQYASTHGMNYGASALIPIRLAAGADPIIGDLSGLVNFGVGNVPEPSTLALAGIGAAMLIIRRRK
jgi:hypothetical protein